MIVHLDRALASRGALAPDAASQAASRNPTEGSSEFGLCACVGICGPTRGMQVHGTRTIGALTRIDRTPHQVVAIARDQPIPQIGQLPQPRHIIDSHQAAPDRSPPQRHHHRFHAFADPTIRRDQLHRAHRLFVRDTQGGQHALLLQRVGTRPTPTQCERRATCARQKRHSPSYRRTSLWASAGSVSTGTTSNLRARADDIRRLCPHRDGVSGRGGRTNETRHRGCRHASLRHQLRIGTRTRCRSQLLLVLGRDLVAPHRWMR